MTDKKGKDEAAGLGTAVLEGPVGQLLKDRAGNDLELVGQDPEGHLITNPLVGGPEINQLCTVVEARQFLGYGGFIAIENQHGLQKALHRDGIYTLSNGQRYVVPFEIHEALGIPLPPVSVPEDLLMKGLVDPGDEMLTGEALDFAIRSKAAREGRDVPDYKKEYAKDARDARPTTQVNPRVPPPATTPLRSGPMQGEL